LSPCPCHDQQWQPAPLAVHASRHSCALTTVLTVWCVCPPNELPKKSVLHVDSYCSR
jgi:hypothetical protein